MTREFDFGKWERATAVIAQKLADFRPGSKQPNGDDILCASAILGSLWVADLIEFSEPA